MILSPKCKSVLPLLVCLIFLLANDPCRSEVRSSPVSADDLLRTCKNSLERMNFSRSMLSVDVTPIYRKWPKAEQKDVKTTYLFSVVRDSECLKIDGNMTIIYNGEPYHKNVFEHTINRDISVRAGKNAEGGQYSGGSVSENLKNEKKFCAEGFPYAFWLDGSIGVTGYDNAVECSLKGNKAALGGTEKINGLDCVIVTAQTEFGTFKFWLDPAADCLYRKVECRKKRRDKGKPRSDDAFTDVSIFIDDVVIEKVQGYDVLTQARMNWEGAEPDGKIGGESYIAKRSQIEINPTFEKDEFSIRLPEGTNVVNLDDRDSGVLYIWDGKKAVPGYTYLEGKAASPIANYFRIFLMVLGVVLIMSGIYLKIREWKNKKTEMNK